MQSIEIRRKDCTEGWVSQITFLFSNNMYNKKIKAQIYSDSFSFSGLSLLEIVVSNNDSNTGEVRNMGFWTFLGALLNRSFCDWAKYLLGIYFPFWSFYLLHSSWRYPYNSLKNMQRSRKRILLSVPVYSIVFIKAGLHEQSPLFNREK